MKTAQIALSSDKEVLYAAYKKVEDELGALELEKKDTLHVKLLMEEAIGLVKGMAADFEGVIWAEEYEDRLSVKLVGSTKMDAEKKHEMLSVAKNKKNAAAVGFTGKIMDFIDNSMLSYDSSMNLQNSFSGVGANFGFLGSTADLNTIKNSGIGTGFMWSMGEYKEALNKGSRDDKDIIAAWDELEKSIIGNVAKDVIVGIKKDKFEIEIKYDVKGV